jgi:hypothetical protein
MNKLKERKIQRKTRKELEYLEDLQSISSLHMDTPLSNEAFKQYLLDSIAWLDAGAE